MHQARKIVFLVLPAAALAGPVSGESPYRRGWSMDGWIAGGSASAVFLSTVYEDYHPGSGAGPYLWAGSLLAAAGDRLSLRPDFTGCRPGLALELRL